VHEVGPEELPAALAGREAWLAVEATSAEAWRELFAGAGRAVEVTTGRGLALLHLSPM